MRNASAILRAFIVCCLSVTGTLPSVCQTIGQDAGIPTNLQIYQDLASACLLPPTDAFTAFRLDADERMAYLVSALHQKWTEAGKRVYVADSSGTVGPLLRYRIHDAGVAYRKIDSDISERMVRLAMQLRVTGEDGHLILDELCERRRSDRIRTGQLATLQHPVYPETQATPPHAGKWRRYLEPAILGMAMGAVVYLFFTVRSGSAST